MEIFRSLTVAKPWRIFHIFEGFRERFPQARLQRRDPYP
jgi:hypothetical protein